MSDGDARTLCDVLLRRPALDAQGPHRRSEGRLRIAGLAHDGTVSQVEAAQALTYYGTCAMELAALPSANT